MKPVATAVAVAILAVALAGVATAPTAGYVVGDGPLDTNPSVSAQASDFPIKGPCTPGTTRHISTGEDRVLWHPEDDPIVWRGPAPVELGTFDVCEGTLQIHVEYQHSPDHTANRRFQLRLFQDNNLDGEYNGEGDTLPTLVTQRQYEGQGGREVSFEVTETYSTLGGRIRPVVTHGGGNWTITITQDPEPQHGIEGTVFKREAGAEEPDRAGGFRVLVIDEEGNWFTARTHGASGEFAFDEVWGYRNYSVFVREPGYTGNGTRVTAGDFLALGFPTWNVDVGTIEVERLEGKGTLVGTVFDEETDDPIEGATVVLRPVDGGDPVSATTGPAGQYRFDYDAGERFTLQAVHPSYEPVGLDTPMQLSEDELRVEDIGMERVGPPDLAVTTSTDHLRLPAGSNLTFTATATNEGEAAVDASLGVAIPSRFSDYVEVDEVTGARDCDRTTPGGPRCDVGELDPGESVDLEVTVAGERAGSPAPYRTVYMGVLARGEKAPTFEPDDANNLQELTVNVTPHRVHGRVATVDKTGTTLPVPRAAVELTFDDGSTRSGFTNETGHYSIEVAEAHDEVSVNVTLKDEEGLIEVYTDHADYPHDNDEVATLVTEPFNVTGATTKVDVGFTTAYGHFHTSHRGPAYGRRIMQDVGVFYANTYTAMEFGRRNLSIDYDHPELPLDIHLWRNGCPACYNKFHARIQVDDDPLDSSFLSPDSPDNSEYHEFGHHVHADSELGGSNGYATRAAGDSNHGGYANSDSTDSVAEGFAAFYSALVSGTPTINKAGTNRNLESNAHRTTIGGQNAPLEEYHVAGLLWDLSDANNERGFRVVVGSSGVSIDDNIALGERATWVQIESADVETVRDLYEELSSDDNLASSDQDGDGISDLDELFILHTFYSDQNENGRYDEEDLVGYPNSFNPRWSGTFDNYPREKPPRTEGTTLDLTVETEAGEALSAVAYRVRVTYADEGPDRGLSDFTYVVDSRESEDSIEFYVPPTARHVNVTPIVPGYAAEPLVQTPEEFWPAVIEAQQANRSAYASHTFTVEDSGVPEPASFEATAVNGTAIALSWEAPGRVVIVGGPSAPPTHPGEGEVVYRGNGTVYVHADLLTGFNYSYTVFSVDGEGLSRGLSASAVTGGPSGTPEDSSDVPLWMWLLGGAGVLVVVLALAYRRRADGGVAIAGVVQRVGRSGRGYLVAASEQAGIPSDGSPGPRWLPTRVSATGRVLLLLGLILVALAAITTWLLVAPTDPLGSVLVVGAVLLLLAALAAPALVWLNVAGTRDGLLDVAGDLPGFRSGAKRKAAGAALGYLLLASMVAFAATAAVSPSTLGPVVGDCQPTLDVGDHELAAPPPEDDVVDYANLTVQQQLTFVRAIRTGAAEAQGWDRNATAVRYRGEAFETQVHRC